MQEKSVLSCKRGLPEIIQACHLKEGEGLCIDEDASSENNAFVLGDGDCGYYI